jgi:hypothetical protein
MAVILCPFCGTEVPDRQRDYGDKQFVNCEICRPYEISGTAIAMLQAQLDAQPPLQGALLAPAVRRLPRSDKPAFIGSDVLKTLLSTAAVPPAKEQATNLIEYLGDRLRGDPAGSVLHTSHQWAAVVGAPTDRGGSYIAKNVEQLGLIHANFSLSGFDAGLTMAGWDEYESIKHPRPAPGTPNENLPSADPSSPIPAADRVVTLDHNSAGYQRIEEQLDKLAEVVRGSNEVRRADPDEADQRIAELDAGTRLLKARRVRLAAIATVLVPALLWVAEKFADTIVGNLATQLIEALKLMLGL